MGVFDDIQKFIEAHRPCGEVTGRAQPNYCVSFELPVP